MTIRKKLVLWYSGLLAVIIILFGTGLYAGTRWVLINSMDVALEETVNQVLKNSRAGTVGEYGNPNQIFVFLPVDKYRGLGVVMQVWELGDTPRLAGASSNLNDYGAPLDQAMLTHEHQLYASGLPANESLYTNVVLDGREWRVLTKQIDVWTRPVVVQAATTMDTVNQASRGVLLLLVGSMAFAVIGSMALGLGLSNRALKPIDAITQSAERVVSADDLKGRLPWNGPMDELGRLTSVLNQMLGRLEELFSVQQRFVADVSHELRTPLTAIRGHLDLIKRYGMDQDSMEAIESEVGRMSRMVSDLLLLARADYGGLTLEFEPRDLDAIIEETHRDALMLANGRSLNIQLGHVDQIRANVDYDRLKQLLLNLVGNAVKFTQDGGTITLSLYKKQRDAIIEVSDTGIGIAPADLPRIFDRFYQADASRQRPDLNEGAGLGLSIAKWIAQAHGGNITVKSELGVGTTFTVNVPHLEDISMMSDQTIVRPRLNIIRRGSQHQVKE
jgi:two-component system, OmpR family, sensor kinase